MLASNTTDTWSFTAGDFPGVNDPADNFRLRRPQRLRRNTGPKNSLTPPWDRGAKAEPSLPAQAIKALVSSSSLSAMACTSAWVGGLEIVRPSGVTVVRRVKMMSKLLAMGRAGAVSPGFRCGGWRGKGPKRAFPGVSELGNGAS